MDNETTVEKVLLPTEDKEYIDVKNGVISTIPNAVIIKIERIQNHRLYEQYVTWKRRMDKENPNIENERKLYHGCAGDTAQKIIHQGFDRSFAGLHRKKHVLL